MIANVRGLVTRKKLTQQKAEGALSLLKGVLDYTEFKDVDMVIEVGYIKSFLFNLVNSSRSTKH
jgi:3-hydroxyacyl-CoA dehydrogenase